MIELILNLILAAVGVFLGAYILFFGRRALWATLGIICFSMATSALAVIAVDAQDAGGLIGSEAWWLLLIAVGFGIAGAALGAYRHDTAALVLGFIGGADIALWFYDIAIFTTKGVTILTDKTELVIIFALILFGGLAGIWLIRWKGYEAIILFSILVGTELINESLRLSESASFTAIILLSLALAGILAQYADYLREQKAGATLSQMEQVQSSIAYFQDLDLG